MSNALDDASSDRQLVASLRAGDEAAFTKVVESFQPALVRVAGIYVEDAAVAEEVVQETWVAALHGLSKFEGRSSFKTWLFTILTNRAKTRAVREGRYVPLELGDEPDDVPSVPQARFNPSNHPHWPHHWAEGQAPQPWDDLPETRFVSQETLRTIMEAIDRLPRNQRLVIRLRDVDGLASEEVCNILGISETNQRVLLHRARSRVRAALESYFSEA